MGPSSVLEDITSRHHSTWVREHKESGLKTGLWGGHTLSRSERRCLAAPKLQEVTETFYLIHANRTQLNSQVAPVTRGSRWHCLQGSLPRLFVEIASMAACHNAQIERKRQRLLEMYLKSIALAINSPFKCRSPNCLHHPHPHIHTHTPPCIAGGIHTHTHTPQN